MMAKGQIGDDCMRKLQKGKIEQNGSIMKRARTWTFQQEEKE